MEVKEASARYVRATGYKQTEVGLIPEDWECAQLPSIIWFQEGPGLRKWQFRTSGLKVINVTNLQEDGYLDLSATERHISWAEFERTYKHFLIDDGDVVMASSGNSYCKTAVVRERDLPLLMNTSVIRFKAKQNISRSFMLIYLKSRYFKRQIDLMITGGAQPNFGPVHLRKVLIPLPTIKAEQEAIAGVLSDADALIESLEQLLAKKRHLKQGAMQQFLRQKVDDNVLLLRDVSFLKGRIGWQGLKQTEFTNNVDEPFLITGMNFKDGAIRWSEVYHISEERYDMAPEIQLRPNDVLMTKDGTIGKVLYIDMIPSPGKASLNSHLLLFRPFREIYNPKYLYYQLGSRRFQNFIELSKSGTTFFGLSQAAIGNYPVLLPPMEEQIRIATVLSDMDTEIATLEEKLIKTRRIKQGMMQELLTGRIRLA